MIADPFTTALAVLLAALVGVAAYVDVRERRVPNVVCLLLLVTYPAVFVTAAAPVPAWSGVATGAAVFAVGALIFAAGWLGGGDVKLLSVLALWAGPGNLAALLLITAVGGGVLAALTWAYSKAAAFAGESRHSTASVTVPYGVAVAGGGLWVAHTLMAA